VREGENNSRAVLYRGSVTEKELTLTIFDANSKEAIDSFTLDFGNEGRVRKCR
jgi:hypothetical protein